mmetsp:Transcript_37254/g.42572  ORF Transcript_37254/g.42572 Transcript_37254/m.42572 type:complete len:143 (+) Transcript_37254:385-813(+)
MDNRPDSDFNVTVTGHYTSESGGDCSSMGCAVMKQDDRDCAITKNDDTIICSNGNGKKEPSFLSASPETTKGGKPKSTKITLGDSVHSIPFPVDSDIFLNGPLNSGTSTDPSSTHILFLTHKHTHFSLFLFYSLLHTHIFTQ